MIPRSLFVLWKEDKFLKHFGKKMTETIAKSLVSKQEATVKGLKNKEDKKFDAVLKLKKNPENGYWNFELSFDKAIRGKASGGKKPPKKKLTFK